MNTTSFFDIGIWLSACGLLATAGLFLDRYHITNNTRYVAHSTAIKAFIYLDRPWLQYPRRYIYNAISGFIMEKRFILLGALALISYTVVVCAFWLGRSLNGEKPPEGFITYFMAWLIDDYYWFWFFIIAIAFLSTTLVAFATDKIIARWNACDTNLGRLTWSTCSIVASLGLSVIGGIMFFCLGSLGLVFIYRSLPIGGSGGLIIEPFFVAVLYIVMNFVPIVISFMALALSLVKTVLDLMVAFAKVILNVSSAPENSPFTYLASLLSLTAAGGKLLYEAVK